MSPSKGADRRCPHVFWKPPPRLCVGSTWDADLLACPLPPHSLLGPQEKKSSAGLPSLCRECKARATAARRDHRALCVAGSVSVSRGCCNKTPRAEQLKQQTFILSILEAAESEIRCQQACFLLRALGRICSGLSPGFRGLPVFLVW